MNRYMLVYDNRSTYKEMHQFRRATSPMEAIKKLCAQYGWEVWITAMTQPEIRGDEYARVQVCDIHGWTMVEAIKCPDRA